MMSLKDKALTQACHDMEMQLTVEGCKLTWTFWQVFQEEKIFIEAKDKKKQELTAKQ